jgi:hypothetical protein
MPTKRTLRTGAPYCRRARLGTRALRHARGRSPVATKKPNGVRSALVTFTARYFAGFEGEISKYTVSLLLCRKAHTPKTRARKRQQSYCLADHSVQYRTSLHFLTPQNGHFLGKRERLSGQIGILVRLLESQRPQNTQKAPYSWAYLRVRRRKVERQD